MALDIDTSELRKLGVDLGDIAPELAVEARGVIQKAALVLKEDMRDDFEHGSDSFHQVARSVTYDTTLSPTGIEAEIGPITLGKVVGDLAHFAYFGGANGGGGTVPDPQYLLEREAKVVEGYLSEIVEKLL